MNHLRIVDVNESFVLLDAEPWLVQEISDCFTFRVDGYKFMPAYKSGIWDGYIRLVDVRRQRAPKGLVPEIIKICSDRDYTVELESGFADRFKEYIPIIKEDLPVDPHDFQIEAVRRCLAKKRQIILSATGSGKSLIIYMVLRSLLREQKARKILVIVPTISLVDQLYKDFCDYSSINGWDVENNCHKIYSGKEKETECPVTISTWQSIYKLPKSFFSSFECVIGDEVHTFQAKACTSIMEKSSNAFYRYGFTGTLQDSQTNEMALRGLFGPVYRVSSTKDLMDKDILAKLSIKNILLQHTQIPVDRRAGCKFAEEIDFIVTNNKRNRFITGITKALNGNTLILIQFIEKHGIPLYDLLVEQLSETKSVHFVHGGTDADQREQIREFTEQNTNVVILASYGVFSTGVNIKNLQNIVFASPTKSKIRVLQSIGRGLRKSQDGEVCTLYDIADDTRDGRKRENYTLKHAKERYKYYIQEGFNVKFIEKKI